jgi:hypothetical protein
VQTLELLVSIGSLWLAGRWLRTSAPSLHRAVRLALAQQALAGAHSVVHAVGGGATQLRSVYLALEAMMCLISTWRTWSAVLLLPVFGVVAQLLLANSVLEVSRFCASNYMHITSCQILSGVRDKHEGLSRQQSSSFKTYQSWCTCP